MRSLAGDCGLAVIVQAMVYGNIDSWSLVGRVSTRDGETGRKGLSGKYLRMATGPLLDDPPAESPRIGSLRRSIPGAWSVVNRIACEVERAMGDAAEFSFIIERGKAWVLSARAMDRTARAAVKIGVDLAKERLIGRKAAIMRVSAASLERLLHTELLPGREAVLLAQGAGASPGGAVGNLAFSAEEARSRARQGESVILVRTETDAADVAAMGVCEGILTSSGGLTSHAAVVARSMGKPCVTGAAALMIDGERGVVVVGGVRLRGGDVVSIDGSRGRVYGGRVSVAHQRPGEELRTLLRWSDRYRRMGVRANADTPAEARLARGLGAEGIGLCRTEHMFFSVGRIGLMQAVILAADESSRRRALWKLLPHQRRDFVGIFRAMDGLPVTIRLLDPPLHEFLPRGEAEQEAIAGELGLSVEQVRHRVEQMREANPMLGHRGVRLAITYPEVAVMQARAILEAASICLGRGIRVLPEIMIPLVMDGREVEHIGRLVRGVAADVAAETGVEVGYRLGSMIETPRAALEAARIAAEAEFLSFGTNDLTQMVLGISRDDAGSFLAEYVSRGILDRDPFEAIDEAGVGELMRIAVKGSRQARPGMRCGLCGEHGGDARSVGFCESIGLDYVSCSPHRVAIARLAAAQAALRRVGG